MEIPGSQEEREQRQVVWFGLSLFLGLCMLAHQTLVCIYPHAAVLIAVIHVLYWKSERMIGVN